MQPLFFVERTQIGHGNAMMTGEVYASEDGREDGHGYKANPNP